MRKSWSHLPAVAVAQNMLDLSTMDHVDSNDYGRYLNLFKDGLSEGQVQLVKELFASHLPPPTEGDLVDGDN
jgi:hypothetical protein